MISRVISPVNFTKYEHLKAKEKHVAKHHHEKIAEFNIQLQQQ